MFKREKAAARESIRRENRLETEPVLFLRGEIEKSPLEEPRAFAGLARPPQRFGEEKLPFLSGAWAAQSGEWSAGAVRPEAAEESNEIDAVAVRVVAGPNTPDVMTRSECGEEPWVRPAQCCNTVCPRPCAALLPVGRQAARRGDGAGRVSLSPHRCGFASFCRRGGIRREIRPAGDHGCGGVRNRSARVRIRLSDAAPESVFFPRPSS